MLSGRLYARWNAELPKVLAAASTAAGCGGALGDASRAISCNWDVRAAAGGDGGGGGSAVAGDCCHIWGGKEQGAIVGMRTGVSVPGQSEEVVEGWSRHLVSLPMLRSAAAEAEGFGEGASGIGSSGRLGGRLR